MPTTLTTYGLAAEIDTITAAIRDADPLVTNLATLTASLRAIVGRRWTVHDKTRQTIAIAAFSADIIPIPEEP